MADIHASLACPDPFLLLYTWEGLQAGPLPAPTGSIQLLEAAPRSVAASPQPAQQGAGNLGGQAPRVDPPEQLQAVLRQAISAAAEGAAAQHASKAGAAPLRQQQQQQQQEARPLVVPPMQPNPGMPLPLVGGQLALLQQAGPQSFTQMLLDAGVSEGLDPQPLVPQPAQQQKPLAPYLLQQQAARQPSVPVLLHPALPGVGSRQQQQAAPAARAAAATPAGGAAASGAAPGQAAGAAEGDARRPRGLLGLLQPAAAAPAAAQAQPKRRQKKAAAGGAAAPSRRSKKAGQAQRQQPEAGLPEAAFNLPVPGGMAAYMWAVQVQQQAAAQQPSILQQQQPAAGGALPGAGAVPPQAPAAQGLQLELPSDSLLQLLEGGNTCSCEGQQPWWLGCPWRTLPHVCTACLTRGWRSPPCSVPWATAVQHAGHGAGRGCRRCACCLCWCWQGRWRALRCMRLGGRRVRRRSPPDPGGRLPVPAVQCPPCLALAATA